MLPVVTLSFVYPCISKRWIDDLQASVGGHCTIHARNYHMLLLPNTAAVLRLPTLPSNFLSVHLLELVVRRLLILWLVKQGLGQDATYSHITTVLVLSGVVLIALECQLALVELGAVLAVALWHDPVLIQMIPIFVQGMVDQLRRLVLIWKLLLSRMIKGIALFRRFELADPEKSLFTCHRIFTEVCKPRRIIFLLLRELLAHGHRA